MVPTSWDQHLANDDLIRIKAQVVIVIYGLVRDLYCRLISMNLELRHRVCFVLR